MCVLLAARQWQFWRERNLRLDMMGHLDLFRETREKSRRSEVFGWHLFGERDDCESRSGIIHLFPLSIFFLYSVGLMMHLLGFLLREFVFSSEKFLRPNIFYSTKSDWRVLVYLLLNLPISHHFWSNFDQHPQ